MRLVFEWAGSPNIPAAVEALALLSSANMTLQAVSATFLTLAMSFSTDLLEPIKVSACVVAAAAGLKVGGGVLAAQPANTDIEAASRDILILADIQTSSCWDTQARAQMVLNRTRTRSVFTFP